eukprot:644979-Prymnesium_polylepis.1
MFGARGTLQTDLRQRFGPEIEAILFASQVWDDLVRPVYRELEVTIDLLRRGELRKTLQQSSEKALRQSLREQLAEARFCWEQQQYVRDMLNVPANETLDVTTTASIAVNGSATYVVTVEGEQVNTTGVHTCYADLMTFTTDDNARNQFAANLAQKVVKDSMDELGLGSVVNVLDNLLPQLEVYEQQGRRTAFQRSADRVNFMLNQSRQLLTASSGSEAMLALLKLTLGAGTLPPITMTVQAEVASAELTAPLTGFGVIPTMSINPFTPWSTWRSEPDGSGFCIEHRSLLFVPPQQFNREATPVATSPLWQVLIALGRHTHFFRACLSAGAACRRASCDAYRATLLAGTAFSATKLAFGHRQVVRSRPITAGTTLQTLMGGLRPASSQDSGFV